MHKILFITQTAKRGGAELSLIDLIKVIKDDISSKSRILFLEEGELLEDDLPIKKEFIRFDVPLKRNFPYLSLNWETSSVERILNLSRNYDIVWTNTQKAHILGWYIKKKTGKIWVVHFRDLLEKWQRKILTHFISDADVIISTSQLVKESLLPLDSVVIYNGIDIYRFKDIIPMQLKKPAVGMISHIDVNKGIEDFIEVSKRFPNINFYLCGKRMFNGKEFIFPDNVHYLGYLNDVRSFIKGLDIGIVLSHREGYGRVAVEMGLAELPFIAYNTGVHSLITNCICKVGDIDCVCDFLKKLLNNTKKCYNKKNIEFFDINKTREEILNLLNRIRR